jgi:AraC-like DNA-binding protein
VEVTSLVASVLSQWLRSLESGVLDATTPQVDLASLESVATPAVMRCVLRLIRRGSPEMFVGVIPLRRDPAVSASRREAVTDRAQFAVHDGSRLFRSRVAADSGLSIEVSSHAPHALVQFSFAVRGQLLTDETHEGRADWPPDLAALESDDHDRRTTAVASGLEAGAVEPPNRHHRILMLRIDSFVQQRLHEASLSPAVIADAHHISVSHLHRLFRSRGVTVAAWIRRQRLEGARRDLGDPAQRDVPVHRIAARWGFTGHSTFTHAFRAAYGTAPQEVRRAGDGRP